ncbi:MAG: hypothetical protein AAF730_13680 [Bacteroidota bacterium]
MPNDTPAPFRRRVPFLIATILFVVSAGDAFSQGRVAVGLLSVVVGALNLGAARGRTPLTRYNELGLFIGDACVALVTGLLAWRDGAEGVHYVWFIASAAYLIGAAVRYRRHAPEQSG